MFRMKIVAKFFMVVIIKCLYLFIVYVMRTSPLLSTSGQVFQEAIVQFHREHRFGGLIDRDDTDARTTYQ